MTFRILLIALMLNAANAAENIVFSVPDLNVKYQINGVNVSLQAYRVHNHKNQWVSIGHPYLVRNEQRSLYSFNDRNILLHLRLLDDGQKLALENEAKRINSNIYGKAYVHLIPLQEIVCHTKFTYDGEIYELHGRAQDLDGYDVTVLVPCVEGSEKRLAFEARVLEDDPISWKCIFTAQGEKATSNRLDIKAETIEHAAVDNKIFGPKDQVYMTRKQVNDFAQTVRNSLQIEEDYELDEEFDVDFTLMWIKTMQSTFVYRYIDDVIENMSRFGFSFDGQDLAPDEIKNRLVQETISTVVSSKQAFSSDEHSTYKSTQTNSEGYSFGFNLAPNVRAITVLTKKKMKKERLTAEAKKDPTQQGQHDNAPPAAEQGQQDKAPAAANDASPSPASTGEETPENKKCPDGACPLPRKNCPKPPKRKKRVVIGGENTEEKTNTKEEEKENSVSKAESKSEDVVKEQTNSTTFSGLDMTRKQIHVTIVYKNSFNRSFSVLYRRTKYKKATYKKQFTLTGESFLGGVHELRTQLTNYTLTIKYLTDKAEKLANQLQRYEISSPSEMIRPAYSTRNTSDSLLTQYPTKGDGYRFDVGCGHDDDGRPFLLKSFEYKNKNRNDSDFYAHPILSTKCASIEALVCMTCSILSDSQNDDDDDDDE